MDQEGARLCLGSAENLRAVSLDGPHSSQDESYGLLSVGDGDSEAGVDAWGGSCGGLLSQGMALRADEVAGDVEPEDAVEEAVGAGGGADDGSGAAKRPAGEAGANFGTKLPDGALG